MRRLRVGGGRQLRPVDESHVFGLQMKKTARPSIRSQALRAASEKPKATVITAHVRDLCECVPAKECEGGVAYSVSQGLFRIQK